MPSAPSSPTKPSSSLFVPGTPTDGGGADVGTAAGSFATGSSFTQGSTEKPEDKSGDSGASGSGGTGSDTTDKGTGQDTPNTVISATMPVPGKKGQCDGVNKDEVKVTLTGMRAESLGPLTGTDNIKIRVEGDVDASIKRMNAQSVEIALDATFLNQPKWKIGTDNNSHFIATISYPTNTTFYWQAVVCDIPSPCQQLTTSHDPAHPMVFTSCDATATPPTTTLPPDDGNAPIDRPIKKHHDDDSRIPRTNNFY